MNASLERRNPANRFEVGQIVWYLPNDSSHGNAQEVSVVGVGPVLATLSNGMKCDTFGVVDGGQSTSPGRCLVSLRDCEYELALREAWFKFQLAVYKSPVPSSMTLASLKQLSTSLGF